jgi:putative tricarboxylic transport membrane protein
MAKADFITSLFLIFLSLFIMIYVLLVFPRFPEWGGLYSNPGFTPFLLGVTLFLMNVYLLIRSLKKQGYQVRVSREGLELFLTSDKVHRFLICFGLFVLYYLLLGRIPFVLNTALYLLLSILIFKGARWWAGFIISGSVSLVVYLIFSRVFLIPLP